MSRTTPSTLSLVATYVVLALFVPALVVLGVSARTIATGIRTGLCPPIPPASEGVSCGLSELLTHTLFGPQSATLTIALTAAWATALAMAMAIYFGMKRLFTSEAAERLH